jgi:hypothetical protein
MKPLATFINDKDGLASRVFRTESGFIVTLMDTDAKRELPTKWHYQEQERALKRAEFLLYPERFSHIEP